ncbi:hypothetical protein C1645_834075 [Glomus cerebriforme]|uniref:Uncharacterized protein n=1 Tax=Glomus cerebriforme TaxID=658196 RepID=A0A397SKA6_9GLOM|nr:hypothetical protein C1645_834075 [Glomus cerebriforme]
MENNGLKKELVKLDLMRKISELINSEKNKECLFIIFESANNKGITREQADLFYELYKKLIAHADENDNFYVNYLLNYLEEVKSCFPYPFTYAVITKEGEKIAEKLLRKTLGKELNPSKLKKNYSSREEKLSLFVLLILSSIPLTIIFAIFPNFRKKAIKWLIKNFLNEKERDEIISSRNKIGKVDDNSKSNQNQFGDNESSSEIKDVRGNKNRFLVFKVGSIGSITIGNNSQKNDKKEFEKQFDKFKTLEKNVIKGQSEELAKILVESEKMLELLKKETERKKKRKKGKQAQYRKLKGQQVKGGNLYFNAKATNYEYFHFGEVKAQGGYVVHPLSQNYLGTITREDLEN